VALEALLARLYTDASALPCFLADPLAAFREVGLSRDVAEGLDRRGLILAVRSFAHKRAKKPRPRPWARRLLDQMGRRAFR
jgi:hypothetical protein